MMTRNDLRAEGRGGFIRNWLGLSRPRGAAVPFETPALRMGRVCDDERDGLIAILRDFANNGSSYIVPWSGLPLIANMSSHDMALHRGIAESKPATPTEVRAVVSELAVSGALGPEAKTRELERRRTGATRLADVELILILHLLSSCGADPAALTMAYAGATTDDVKTSLTAAAAEIGIKRQEIYQRVSDFARLLGPVGLIATEGSISPGWLRVLHREIEAFGGNCASSPQAEIPEVAVALAPIAKSASRTAHTSATVLSIIDYSVLDIRTTMRRWTTEQQILKQVIDRLSVMLDEWPALMSAVHEALRGPEPEIALQLRRLGAALPPPSATDPAPEDDKSEGSDTVSAVNRALAARLSTIRAMLTVPQPVN
jgi:hypothetical protein